MIDKNKNKKKNKTKKQQKGKSESYYYVKYQNHLLSQTRPRHRKTTIFWSHLSPFTTVLIKNIFEKDYSAAQYASYSGASSFIIIIIIGPYIVLFPSKSQANIILQNLPTLLEMSHSANLLPVLQTKPTQGL